VKGVDSIPHAELMKAVTRRVSDRHLLGLIKAGLEMPVEEFDLCNASFPPSSTYPRHRRLPGRHVQCHR
jgi:hypothetical protein